jgi:cytochrome c oxidase subunit II
MNVVPGMITQFGFTPTQTTDEIRETEYMVDKIDQIGEIRRERSEELMAAGKEPLSDYTEFDYYLLCNKICGVAHYNMQMKVVVETEEEFNAWIAEQQEFIDTIESEDTQNPADNGNVEGEEVAQVEN